MIIITTTLTQFRLAFREDSMLTTAVQKKYCDVLSSTLFNVLVGAKALNGMIDDNFFIDSLYYL